MNEIVRQLLANWQRTFFTGFLVDLIFIVCIIVGLIYFDQQKEKLFFIIYFFIGAVLFIGLDVLEAFNFLANRRLRIIFELGNTAFEIFEFSAFYFFFIRLFKKKIFIWLAYSFLVVLLITCSIFFGRFLYPGYSVINFQRHSLYINVMELFFVAVLCLSYFYELLTAVPKLNLLRRPSFFIVTTAFFYSILTLPFFVVAHDMYLLQRSLYDMVFSFHFIFLILMLAAILNAFTCKTGITI
jgi:hypothetical protein